jgi:hypothetical protein
MKPRKPSMLVVIYYEKHYSSPPYDDGESDHSDCLLPMKPYEPI